MSPDGGRLQEWAHKEGILEDVNDNNNRHQDCGENGDPKSIYLKIAAELGGPFHKTRSSYSINQYFFARLWCSKRLAIYDQASEGFYHYLPGKGLFESLRENEIRRLISEDLFEAAKGFGSTDIGSKANPGCQRAIIDLIKSDAKACHEDFFKRDDTAPPAIHAANGMVCISVNGIELKPFSSD